MERVTSDFFIFILPSSDISSMVLEDCCIQDDDVSILAAGLKRICAHDTICKVRTLALTNNYITAKGAKALATVLTS